MTRKMVANSIGVGGFVRSANPDSFAPVAKWLRRSAHNREIIGSIPIGSTI